MTIKALKNQLMAAVAMTLVAAVALGSSTFAWFASNASVTATTAQVNVASDSAFLGIKNGHTNGSAGDYSTSATTTAAVNSLFPCTSFDGITFGKLNSSVLVASATSSQATWTGASNAFQASDIQTISTGINSYVLANEYDIYYKGATATDVYVKSITVSNGSTLTDIDNALRVAVTLEGGNTLVFRPNGSAAMNDSGKVGKETSGTWSLDTPTYVTANTAGAKLNTTQLSDGDMKDVTVSMWYEGQDADCKTSNITVSNLTVTMELTTTAPTP